MPIIFYLESRGNKKGENPIRLSAIVKGARIQSTTGFSINPDAWDKNSMRVKPHQINSKKQTSAQINKYLNGIEGVVLDFENTCRVRPSLDKLKEVIISYNPGVDPNTEVGEEQDKAPKRPSAISYFDEYEYPVGTKVMLHKNDGEEYEKEVHDASALAKTRDLFCFCAFTSLRYSDMAALKRGDIHEDYIDITTLKTYDHLPINLNTFAKEILEKYKDCKFPKGLALPVICNQKMNDYIKELCELCEINDPISKVCYRAGQREEETKPKYEYIGTHAARRTFICFALSAGIPPQVVMKWIGHSDYKAMKPYIDIAEKTKAEQMAIFEKGLMG